MSKSINGLIVELVVHYYFDKINHYVFIINRNLLDNILTTASSQSRTVLLTLKNSRESFKMTTRTLWKKP